MQTRHERISPASSSDNQSTVMLAFLYLKMILLPIAVIELVHTSKFNGNTSIRLQL
jgi:hypothetical protein